MKKSPGLTPEQFRDLARRGAFVQVVAIVAEFPELLHELNRAANGNGTAPVEESPRPRRRRRRLSADARKRISDAQRKRWARTRQERAK